MNDHSEHRTWCHVARFALFIWLFDRRRLTCHRSSRIKWMHNFKNYFGAHTLTRLSDISAARWARKMGKRLNVSEHIRERLVKGT